MHAVNINIAGDVIGNVCSGSARRTHRGQRQPAGMTPALGALPSRYLDALLFARKHQRSTCCAEHLTTASCRVGQGCWCSRVQAAASAGRPTMRFRSSHSPDRSGRHMQTSPPSVLAASQLPSRFHSTCHTAAECCSRASCSAYGARGADRGGEAVSQAGGVEAAAAAAADSPACHPL